MARALLTNCTDALSLCLGLTHEHLPLRRNLKLELAITLRVSQRLHQLSYKRGYDAAGSTSAAYAEFSYEGL